MAYVEYITYYVYAVHGIGTCKLPFWPDAKAWQWPPRPGRDPLKLCYVFHAETLVFIANHRRRCCSLLC